jgi:hypothetical protein
MSAGRGHFERAFGAFLSFDVGKVERTAGNFADGSRPFSIFNIASRDSAHHHSSADHVAGSFFALGASGH